MQWIDDIILGLIDKYETNDPCELCDYLNIKIIKLEPDNLLFKDNKSLYLRNYFNQEIIYIKDNLDISYEKFYVLHELGHAILHPDLKNSLNEKLVNNYKVEKQANYFALKLSNLTFDQTELYRKPLNQIANILRFPENVLGQLINL